MSFQKHLSEPELQLFFEGSSDAALRRRVVRHLLSECEQCCSLAAKVGGPFLRLPSKSDQVVSFVLTEAGLTQFARRAERDLQATFEREKVEAFDLWKATRGDLGRIKVDERFATASFILLLVNESREVARDDPRRGLAIAKKAQALVERMTGGVMEVVKQDLRAQVFVSMANAYRLSERFKDATKHLQLARDIEADITTQAYCAKISGALLRDIGEFERAVEEMHVAYKIHSRLGDDIRTGSTLIALADVYKHFAPESGVTLAKRAQSILRGQDERLETCAIAATIDCITESGKVNEAAKMFTAHRKRLVRRDYGLRHTLKIRWLAARIDRLVFLRTNIQDSFEAAEATYLQLMDDFECEGMYQELSLAAIQLAELYNAAERKEDAVEHLANAITSCSKSGVRADLMEALRMLSAILEEGRLTDQAIAAATRTLTRRWKVKGEPTNS